MRAGLKQVGILLAGAYIFALLTPVTPALAEDSPVAELAFAQVQRCMSDPDAQLNVLYVVDESGSLTTTDPEGVRADAIAQSLGQLAQLSERRTVYTSIAMFAEGYGMVETGGGVAIRVSPPMVPASKPASQYEK